MKNIKLLISGMGCAACAVKIDKKLNGIKSVKANVNFASSKASVIFSETEITSADILKAVESLGYKATILENDNKGETLPENSKEILYLKYSFIVSFILSLPLVINMFLEMTGTTTILGNGILQLLLAGVVQFVIGWRFYKNAWKALKHFSSNMDLLVVLGTTAAYFYSIYNSFFANQHGHGAHLYFESSAVLITLILLGKFFETRAKERTSQAVRKLMELKPSTANLYSEKAVKSIRVEEIKIGDILLVKPGEKIPVGGEIVYGSSTIDESMLTGESMPVAKTIGDKVFDATINKSGAFRFRAEKIGDDTALSRIIRMLEEAQGTKAPIQKLADRVSLYFVPAIIIIAILTFIIWILFGDLSYGLVSAISVLVIACPCALGLATPTAIMVGTGKGAEMGIFIKGGEVLEKSGRIDAVVFDKTGTLSVGKPVVSGLFPENGLSEEEFIELLATGEKMSEHPLAEAILDKADKLGIKQLSDPEEFNSIAGKGLICRTKKGILLIGSKKFLEENRVKVSSDINEGKKFRAATFLHAALDGNYIGCVAIQDTVKDGAKEAVSNLHAMGYEVYMITGDNKAAAEFVADELGIKHVFAETLPEDKIDKVKELQAVGLKVAMVGDGINDAPALAAADLGIAMGNGTDIAIETGDIVLTGGDIALIPEAINLSQKTLNKIKQNLFWAFIYNIIGIPVAALGFLNPMIAGAAMAFSSVSVVLNSLSLLKYKKNFSVK
ncbi:MAG TPA: heavy metal translocating P-type ATPase [Lentisphaeria bacterium]|nr:MAG: copper-translocating P-type ATPase [Lentisphaerae bacterium GWF2_38_69]HBM17311.1 heavy metal translocating P-type ATPase [Lentisphaeria bacterium]